MEVNRTKLEKIIELLTEVKNKQGAYSRDQLTHAENVIDNASEKAQECIKMLEGMLSE